MYRIRLYLAAAAFLVTAVSGNLTSMTFGRRRGILSLPCIVGLSRASHRGRRQMKIGPSIALGGPTIIRTHYPPSSDGSSSLATAVSLRGGGIDANSSSFQLGYQLGYQLGRTLQKMLIFFLGYYVGQHTKSKQTPIDHKYQYRRQPDYATTNGCQQHSQKSFYDGASPDYGGDFRPAEPENDVSNSAARDALGMRGGATVAESTNNTYVEKDQGWMWCYVLFRFAVPIRNLTLLDLVFLCWAASHFNGPAVPRKRRRVLPLPST